MFPSTILEHVLFEEAWPLTEHSQECAPASCWWPRLFLVRISGLFACLLGNYSRILLIATSSMPVFTLVSWLCKWAIYSLTGSTSALEISFTLIQLRIQQWLSGALVMLPCCRGERQVGMLGSRPGWGVWTQHTSCLQLHEQHWK